MKEERRGREVEQLTFNNLQSKSDSRLQGIRQTENDIYVHNHQNILRGNRYELHSDGDGSWIQLRQSSLLFFSVQLIQTISAVDTDEPLVGHKFIFSISPTNPNFTIVDREGKTCVLIRLKISNFRLFLGVFYRFRVASTVLKGSVCVSPQRTRPTS